MTASLEETKKNYDSKGVKRGRCQQCDECSEFEWLSSYSLSTCSYCGCPPVKHVKLTNEVNESHLPNTSSGSLEKPNARKTIGSKKPLLPQTSQQNLQIDLKSLIPESFPHGIDRLLKNAVPLQGTEINAIVRSVCLKMFEKGITEVHQIDRMAVLLTEKYSTLNGRFGSNHLMIKEKMKYCLQYQKKIKKTKTEDHTEHDALCNEMVKEASTTERCVNIGKLETLLDKTRCLRQKNINKMTSATLLKTYPALRNPDLMLRELSKLVDLPVATIRSNWMQAIPNILKAVKVVLPEDATNNEKCVHLLINLPKLFIKAKQYGRIYRFFPKGSTFAACRPQQNEPPTLLAIADSSTPFNSLQMMCYVDGETLFEAHAFDAVLYLISAYWVFNIAFPNDAKLQFHFLSIAILKESGLKQMKSNVLKSSVLNDALQLAQLTK